MTNVDPRIDVIGAAIGDRSRCLIVTALMDGRAYTAKELAYRARVSAQTASFHLKHLVDCGLLARHQRGRHRYFFLANEDVASMIEAVMRVAPTEHLRRQPKRTTDEMALARCCYNHLAGLLGVAVANRLTETSRPELPSFRYSIGVRSWSAGRAARMIAGVRPAGYRGSCSLMTPAPRRPW